MIMKAYLDHAAASPVDPRVLEVMDQSYKEIYGNPASVHNKGREEKTALDNARDKIADKRQADPDRIFFTSA